MWQNLTRFVQAVVFAALMSLLGMGCVAHSGIGVGETQMQCNSNSSMPTLSQPPQ